MNAIVMILEGKQKLTFREELGIYGIPVLPYSAVVLHQLRMFWSSAYNRVVALIIAVAVMSSATAAMLTGHKEWFTLIVFAIVVGYAIMQHWRSFDYSWFSGMPRRLQQRAEHLGIMCPDAEVRVLAFEKDPFLIVKDPYKIFFSKTYYIGAWETNVPELDNA